MGCVFIVGWNSWSLLGGVIGPALDDPVDIGFDFAFSAMFIVLIVGFWKNAATGAVLAASGGTAVFVHAHVSGAWYILAGAFAGMIAAALFWRPESPEAPASPSQLQGEWSTDTPGSRLDIPQEAHP